MINAEELAICRRRGHCAPGIRPRGGWIECGFCGMWLREKIVCEEREDEPPEDEIDPGVRTDRALRKIKARIDEMPK